MRISDWSSDVCSSDLRIADPSKVQIEAAVGPIDAQRLAPGDRAIIELPDGRTIDARVRAVTPGLGGETRSATAVLDVTGSLQPGLAVRVRLLPSRGEVSDAIVISEDALQSLRSEEHTSELQSLIRKPYAVFCLK